MDATNAYDVPESLECKTFDETYALYLARDRPTEEEAAEAAAEALALKLEEDPEYVEPDTLTALMDGLAGIPSDLYDDDCNIMNCNYCLN